MYNAPAAAGGNGRDDVDGRYSFRAPRAVELVCRVGNTPKREGYT